LYESWLNESTADYWRHIRSFEIVRLVAESRVDNEQVNWLTIGDGRLGLDSIRIRSLGFNEVLATDISPHLLDIAKSKGLIKDFKIENAEKLSFEDESFDYVFCKESLHHFPQPYKALYESLRCARKGLILIEPNDVQQTDNTFSIEEMLIFAARYCGLLAYSFKSLDIPFRKPGEMLDKI
jgi:ubiquinone/menaquinone biosynthesis C-methylase UbiE